jgi:glucose/arabinose dehydrogenase
MTTSTSRLTLPFLLLGTVLLLSPPLHARGYATRGSCEGYPQVQVQAPAGYCVALVADERQGLTFPRRMLEIAPGRFWVVDMGNWNARQGRLLEMTLTPGKAGVTMTTLASGLDRPHGLARGPDGKIYIAEATRIWRSAADRFAPETVIDRLPGEGSHPLKEIAFGSGGRLYVNVGSATDACRNDAQQQPLPCPEVESVQPRAAVYEAVLGGPLWQLQSFKPWATGLRNSMALAVYQQPGQPDVVLQGENSVDYADEAAPQEELNHLQAGGHYGWPYCVEDRQPARGYEGRYDCQSTRAPSALWPAHTAPLHMLVAPVLADHPWSGQLLVAWHGYRAAGHRVMAFRLDAAGRVTAPGTELLGNWSAQNGVRPLGAPAGLALDTKGRLFVVEDRNRTILMLGRIK